MSEIEALERRYMSEPVGESVASLGEAPGTSGARTAGREERTDTPDDNTCSSSQQDDEIIQHFVTKSDTLAGLAIKYNVSVLDIKRANGLMSENMMWSRAKLLIPREPMPLSNEDILKGAQLLSGYGGHIDSSRVRMRRDHDSQLASSAVDQLSSYYELNDRHSLPTRTAFRPSSPSAAGDVELMDRTPSSGVAAADDRVRLRKRADSTDGQAPLLSDVQHSRSAREPSYNCLPGVSGSRGSKILSSLRGAFADIMEPAASSSGPPPPASLGNTSEPSSHNSGAPARKRESIFQKIHRAASQPALAGTSNFSALGDAFVQRSRRRASHVPDEPRNVPATKARKAD